LAAVSCSGAGTCTAVGNLNSSEGQTTLIEASTAFGAWAVGPSPNPVGAKFSFLQGVSCPSADACTAVGYYQGPSEDGTLVEAWDGAAWTIQPSPTPTGQAGTLSGVSCPTTSMCAAVGFSTSLQNVQTALVEREEAGLWSVDAVALPAGSPTSSLASVSCTAAFACTAVGSYVDSAGIEQVLILRWNGSTWTPQPTAGPPRAGFSGVSCPSRKTCVAVGFSTDAGGSSTPLIERWDGATWTQVTDGLPAGSSGSLAEVSCSAVDACTAIGMVGAPGVGVPVAERSEGSTWSAQQMPQPSYPSRFELQSEISAVSCPTWGACTAVGATAAVGVQSEDFTLLENWSSGGWRIAASPPSGPAPGELLAVSCATTDSCTAVGHEIDMADQWAPLVERWDGTGWRAQVAPNPSTPASAATLEAVACPAANDCSAVGMTGSAGGTVDAFIEHWDGSSWTIVPAAPPPSDSLGTALLGISCAASGDCTAVGYLSTSTINEPLIEHWNGQAWTLEQAAVPASGFAVLRGVSCPSHTFCVAVGNGTGPALIESWDGSAWQIKASEVPPGAENGSFSAVSCSSSDACTAVGAYQAVNTGPPLVERWDGAAWTAQPQAGSLQFGVLDSVSCPSGSSCTAVGNNNGAFAEQWNGAGWTAQTLPAASLPGSLLAVDCLPNHDCQAVGVDAFNLIADGYNATAANAALGMLRVSTSPAVSAQILLDGHIADSGGLNWVQLPAGTHTVGFTHVQGYSEPAPQSVTITAGTTTSVVGTYTPRGELHVTTSPPVPSAISVDGNPSDNFGLWTDLPTGTHQICFGAVTGYTPPSCQTVTLTAGTTTTLTGTFTPDPTAPAPSGLGTLDVVSSPALPTQISITPPSGPPYLADSWSLNWLQLPPGTYTITASHVPGYSEPAPQTVTILADVNSFVSENFQARGELRVTTNPATPALVIVDGAPADNWGVWTDIPPGVHQVCFGWLPGYINTPPCQTATITAGTETDITGTYS
jgi:hypothetical protein